MLKEIFVKGLRWWGTLWSSSGSLTTKWTNSVLWPRWSSSRLFTWLTITSSKSSPLWSFSRLTFLEIGNNWNLWENFLSWRTSCSWVTLWRRRPRRTEPTSGRSSASSSLSPSSTATPWSGTAGRRRRRRKMTTAIAVSWMRNFTTTQQLRRSSRLWSCSLGWCSSPPLCQIIEQPPNSFHS